MSLRLRIQSLITGRRYAPEIDGDAAAWISARPRAYGHPERRVAIVDIEDRHQPAILDTTTMEMVWPAIPAEPVLDDAGLPVLDPETGGPVLTDPVPEIRRALMEVEPALYWWHHQNGLQHPTLDGADLVVAAQHSVTVEDITAEREAEARAEARRQRIREQIGQRGELIDLALAAGMSALFRGEPFSSIPQRYRRVLQRLETIALDPALQPGDEA